MGIDSDGERDVTRDAALAALDRARAELAHGTVERAWIECLSAAALARELGDAGILADAATLIPGPQVGSHHLTVDRQALCLEAITLLGDADPSRRQRIENYLAGLSSGWTRLPSTAPPLADDETDAVLLRLRAAHAAAMAPDQAQQRLEIATQLRDVARSAHRDDDSAWGLLWRLDALAQLGRRIELNADFIELTGVVRRLESRHWRWRTAAIRAQFALLDDDIDDVPSLAANAALLGAAAGVPESAFIDLILRSELALRTGEGLVEVEAEVRRALADQPFLAQGWRAGILIALGRSEDALEIWRALAPHLSELPPTAMEWLLAATAHAELSIFARDHGAAERLYGMLAPHAALHVMPTVMTPYSGPVALHLGNLAAFLGRPAIAREHLDDALARSQEMHAPAYSRRAREAIARLSGDSSALSPREKEVAELVGAGLTNREIAQRLFLSERTVENHVSSILRRLDVPNRAAVAAWVSRQ